MLEGNPTDRVTAESPRTVSGRLPAVSLPLAVGFARVLSAEELVSFGSARVDVDEADSVAVSDPLADAVSEDVDESVAVAVSLAVAVLEAVDVSVSGAEALSSDSEPPRKEHPLSEKAISDATTTRLHGMPHSHASAAECQLNASPSRHGLGGPSSPRRRRYRSNSRAMASPLASGSSAVSLASSSCRT